MIQIRAALPEDRARIIEILNLYNMGNFGHAERVAMPKIEHFFIAEGNKQIVGCCAFLLSTESEIAKQADEAETGSLAVIPEYRGKGVGEALQKVRMKKLCIMGINKLFSETDRKETINWYIRKFGYEIISTREKKFLNFGDPNVNTFTLLKVDLAQWKKQNPEI